MDFIPADGRNSSWSGNLRQTRKTPSSFTSLAASILPLFYSEAWTAEQNQSSSHDQEFSIRNISGIGVLAAHSLIVLANSSNACVCFTPKSEDALFIFSSIAFSPFFHYFLVVATINCAKNWVTVRKAVLLVQNRSSASNSTVTIEFMKTPLLFFCSYCIVDGSQSVRFKHFHLSS